MPTDQITIATTRGYDLAGALEMPTGLVRGAAVFAHCFTCTKQSKAAVEVTRALARQGIATLRFDFTGLGGSDGEFGQLFGNSRDGLVGVLGEFVAEAHAIVEHAHPHGQRAFRGVARLAEGDRELVMPVVDELALAPRLLPRVVEAARHRIFDHEIAAQRFGIGEREAQLALADQRVPVAGDGVVGNAVAIDIERGDDPSVGRGHVFRQRGHRRAREQTRECEADQARRSIAA